MGEEAPLSDDVFTKSVKHGDTDRQYEVGCEPPASPTLDASSTMPARIAVTYDAVFRFT